MNQRLRMEWLTVERKTLPIVLRSVGILMNSVVHGGLYQLYLTAQRDNQNFKLAYIPEDFQMESREFFDVDYINACSMLAMSPQNLARNGQTRLRTTKPRSKFPHASFSRFREPA